MLILSYLVLGACAGMLAGLFGIGGGLIIVPVLVFSFGLQGMSPEVLTHVAVATSLATIVVTSLSSVRSHHLKQGVRWDIFKPLAVGIIIGAIFGVKTAVVLSGSVLQLLLGCFAILISIQMGLGFKPKPTRQVPKSLGLGLMGSLVGYGSALFGIGGGSMTTPYLSWCNVRIQQAIGTSAACGLPIAITGALVNIQQGWGHPALMPWSLGYVYVPAFVGIVLTSAWFARYGARLAHALPERTLKRAFAVLLLLVGIRFLTTALGG
ncbi:MAG: sulfite exporter TauE/SafE family protein [Motiliproteus sp.]